MRRPFVLVQLSDPHIGAEWGDADPAVGLAATVEAVRALELPPDAVLVSGDLADHASDAEYELVRELLAPLAAPVYVLPGNHDDRDALRRHFDVGSESVRFSAELPAFAVHALLDGELVSHVQSVVPPPPADR